MDNMNYDLIINAKKVFTSNAGYYTKKNALDFLYNKLKENNELKKEIEKSVHGISKKINHLQELIEESQEFMKNDRKLWDNIIKKHKKEKITKEEYALMEKYVPGINQKLEEETNIKTKLEPDNINIDEVNNNINIEDYKKEIADLDLKLKNLEEQRKNEDRSFPLTGKEVDKKEEVIEKIDEEEINILNEQEKLYYAVEMYNKKMEKEKKLQMIEEVNKEEEPETINANNNEEKEKTNNDAKVIETLQEIIKEKPKHQEEKTKEILQEIINEHKKEAELTEPVVEKSQTDVENVDTQKDTTEIEENNVNKEPETTEEVVQESIETTEESNETIKEESKLTEPVVDVENIEASAREKENNNYKGAEKTEDVADPTRGSIETFLEEPKEEVNNIDIQNSTNETLPEEEIIKESQELIEPVIEEAQVDLDIPKEDIQEIKEEINDNNIYNHLENSTRDINKEIVSELLKEFKVSAISGANNRLEKAEQKEDKEEKTINKLEAFNIKVKDTLYKDINENGIIYKVIKI